MSNLLISLGVVSNPWPLNPREIVRPPQRWPACSLFGHGLLTRYVKLRVAHAPGMPGTFFPAADFKGNRKLAIPACISARASRTCRDSCRDRLPAVAGKTFPAFPGHATRNFTYLVRSPWSDRQKIHPRTWMRHGHGNMSFQTQTFNVILIPINTFTLIFFHAFPGLIDDGLSTGNTSMSEPMPSGLDQWLIIASLVLSGWHRSPMPHIDGLVQVRRNSRALAVELRLRDDVIKWKHFLRYWPFVRWIHRSPVNSRHKGQWHGALMFSLICVWIIGWVNNREAGDLRRYRAHYDVSVMSCTDPSIYRSIHLDIINCNKVNQPWEAWVDFSTGKTYIAM